MNALTLLSQGISLVAANFGTVEITFPDLPDTFVGILNNLDEEVTLEVGGMLVAVDAALSLEVGQFTGGMPRSKGRCKMGARWGRIEKVATDELTVTLALKMQDAT